MANFDEKWYSWGEKRKSFISNRNKQNDKNKKFLKGVGECDDLHLDSVLDRLLGRNEPKQDGVEGYDY